MRCRARLGLLARIAAPDLAVPGVADTVVLLLPSRVFPGVVGELLTALIVAGAFAAFLATSAGLVVSLAGVISQDVFSGSVRSFRLSAVLCAMVPLVIALLTAPAGLGSSVGVVFVVAASTLSPVVLLGVWWRGLTARGAVAGMVSGGLAAGLALLVHAAVGGVGVAAPYLAQPARLDDPARHGRDGRGVAPRPAGAVATHRPLPRAGCTPRSGPESGLERA